MRHLLLVALFVAAAIVPVRQAFRRSRQRDDPSRMTVWLLDAGGEPRTGSDPYPCPLNLESFLGAAVVGPPNRWPGHPVVHVLRAVGPTPVPVAEEARIGQVHGPDRIVYEVEPGLYWVGATGSKFNGSFQTVEVCGDGPVDVELRAAQTRELGTVEVTVRLGDTGREPLSQFEVFLEDRESAAVLVSQRRGRPICLEAPAGPYRLVAAGRAKLDGLHGTLLSERKLGRVERDIVLRASQKLAVDLVFTGHAWGQLDVTTHGELNEDDRESTRPEPSSLVLLGRDSEAAAHRVVLELHRSGRRPEVVRFRGMFEHIPHHGPYALGFTKLGSNAVSQRLPTGRYELVARLPGGREVRQHVTLRDEEILPVTLTFE